MAQDSQLEQRVIGEALDVVRDWLAVHSAVGEVTVGSPVDFVCAHTEQQISNVSLIRVKYTRTFDVECDII